MNRTVQRLKSSLPHGVSRVWERVSYETAFLAVLVVYFQNQVPSMESFRTDGWWLGGFWYVTYDLGFVSRGLAGSLVSLFCKHLPPPEMNRVIAGCWLVLATWVAVFCGWLVRRASERDRLAVLYVVSVFLVMPCSFSQYCNSEMFGKLDLFHLPLLLGAAGLTVHGRMLGWVPVLVAAGILIHPSFFFLYFPSIFFALGYRTAWRARGLLSCLAVVAIGLFGGLQLYGQPADGEALATYVARCSGVEWAFNQKGFYYAYFATLKEQWDLLLNYGARPITNALVVFLTVLSPVWLLPAWLWNRTLGGAVGRDRKALWLLCGGPLVCALPVFLALDWTRWFGALVICQFVSLLTLHAGGCRAAQESISAFDVELRRRPLLFGFVAFGLAILPRTEVSGLLLNPGFTALLKGLGISL